MKYLLISIITLIVAGSCIFGSSLMGPVNRIKNTVDDKLNAEFVVDNYKAEYNKLFSNKTTLLNSIHAYNVEKRVIEKKLNLSENELNTLSKHIKHNGLSDLKKINKLKHMWNTKQNEISTYHTMLCTYSNAIIKLEKALECTNINLIKTEHNINVLESKKQLVDTLKIVNSTVENLTRVGNSDLTINLEKLEDDVLRESIKLETLDTITNNSNDLDVQSAEQWIKSL